MQVVTNASHPNLFGAIISVAYDNGMVNRHASEPCEVRVLSKYDLAEVDAAIAGLTEQELDDFCNGEHGEMAALRARTPQLAAANDLLNDWFNGEADDVSADRADDAPPEPSESA